MNPHIKILILNWNGIGVIEDCLDSVLKINYPNFSISVIDNGSIDNSISYIKQYYPKIDIIENNKNLGYGRGYNRAFEKYKNDSFDYYLVLNNDTVVPSDLLNNLYYNLMKYGPDNIYSPKINDLKGKIWFAGAKLIKKLGITNHTNIRNTESLFSCKTHISDYVPGCCMLISKRLIEKLNGFNETFSMYYEDVDLCLRAKYKNIKSIVIEESSIVHHISYSLKNKKVKKILSKLVSMIKFIYLHNNLLIFSLALLVHLILIPVFIIKIIYEEI